MSRAGVGCGATTPPCRLHRQRPPASARSCALLPAARLTCSSLPAHPPCRADPFDPRPRLARHVLRAARGAGACACVAGWQQRRTWCRRVVRRSCAERVCLLLRCSRRQQQQQRACPAPPQPPPPAAARPGHGQGWAWKDPWAPPIALTHPPRALPAAQAAAETGMPARCKAAGTRGAPAAGSFGAGCPSPGVAHASPCLLGTLIHSPGAAAGLPSRAAGRLWVSAAAGAPLGGRAAHDGPW